VSLTAGVVHPDHDLMAPMISSLAAPLERNLGMDLAGAGSGFELELFSLPPGFGRGLGPLFGPLAK
jgi:hypothetical protein